MTPQDQKNSHLPVNSRSVIGKYSKYTKQIMELRDLCRLMVENQEKFLRIISDKLDEIETDLSGTDIDTVSSNND